MGLSRVLLAIAAADRARGLRTLVFTGRARNLRVESTARRLPSRTLRVLLEDATHHLGSDFVHQATLSNAEKFFRWAWRHSGPGSNRS